MQFSAGSDRACRRIRARPHVRISSFVYTLTIIFLEVASLRYQRLDAHSTSFFISPLLHARATLEPQSAAWCTRHHFPRHDFGNDRPAVQREACTLDAVPAVALHPSTTGTAHHHTHSHHPLALRLPLLRAASRTLCRQLPSLVPSRPSVAPRRLL